MTLLSTVEAAGEAARRLLLRRSSAVRTPRRCFDNRCCPELALAIPFPERSIEHRGEVEAMKGHVSVYRSRRRRAADTGA